MPYINLNRAQNFTISGGNFNDVAGNVTTFNIGNGMEQLPPNALASLVHSGNQVSSQDKRRIQDHEPMRSPLPNAHIQAVPSSNASGSPPASVEEVASPGRSRRHRHNRSHFPVSTSAQPPLSPNRTAPPPTDSFQSLEPEGFNTASSRNSLTRSTPPTDFEEHHNVCTSDVPSPNQRQNEADLLTPLTNSLGLRQFTPSRPQQTLSLIDETLTPVQQPLTQVLSPAIVTPALFGLELPRTSSHSTSDTSGAFPSGPPRIPPRPESHASYRPPALSRQTQSQIQTEVPSLRGPPPPVPSRDSLLSPTWTSIAAPLDTPFRSVSGSSPLPPTAPSSVPSPISRNQPSPSSVEHQELEDPSARFARLQSERSSTKGYASHLSPISQSPSNAASSYRNPPPAFPASPMAGPSSLADVATPAQNPTSPFPDVAAPQASHWTPNTISGWAGDVRERGARSDSPSSGEDRSATRAPTTPPHYHAQRHEEQYQYRQPQPAQQYHYDHHMDRARQETAYNALWGQPNQERPPHQPPITFNHAPPPGSFPAFHINAMPPLPIAVPPLGAPMFNGPQMFGGPAFGGAQFWW